MNTLNVRKNNDRKRYNQNNKLFESTMENVKK